MATAHELVEMVARRSYGKLVALIAARTRDVSGAEDALSEAFTVALAQWPQTGLPANPEAWLLTVARRKSINVERHRRMGEAVSQELQRILPDASQTDIPDERLALMFACAHPAIDQAIRAPLILQTVLGLEAARIASAFLVSPSAMSQRLVRAKTKIREAAIPFRIPEREELPARVDAVLDAIYGAFAESWLDASAGEGARRDLATEAIFLARLAADLLPGEAEALGLLALLLYSEARHPARRNCRGEYVPLDEQNTELWDAAMVQEAESLLLRASKFGVAGRYQLEAAVQSAHAHRLRSGCDNWEAIVQLYDALFALTGSPVVALSRAVAIAKLHGPAIALALLDEIATDSRLNEYQPYWAARADLLAREGRTQEAQQAYALVVGLERDPAVRDFLQQSAAKTLAAGR
jgi:predicted RNA polymerase sigma factor